MEIIIENTSQWQQKKFAAINSLSLVKEILAAIYYRQVNYSVAETTDKISCLATKFMSTLW